MRLKTTVSFVALAAVACATTAIAQQVKERYKPPVTELEDYQRDPMPAGISVQHSDVDGPVFVDARGHTLYTWPLDRLRNGDAGEQKGKPSCDDTKYTENSGLMSPYPPGLVLPDLDTRPTCIQVWPALYAPEGAKEIGKWTVVDRPDGKKQWAYDGFAVYTSVLDTKPGTVNGATGREQRGDAPALRKPIGPPPNHPPAFAVKTVATGRLLTNHIGFSAYVWDGDAANKSNCVGNCLNDWSPILASQSAQPQGEWGVIERSPGVKQWTYRTKPVYTRVQDRRFRSLEGGDVAGWHNVYTQKWPNPPQEFTVQDSRIGQVLADKNGMTLYVYQCGDDALDQLSCDHPTTTQAYRLAICGNGDPALCNKTFAYVPAPRGVKVNNMIWGTSWIDPQTGHLAKPEAPGAVHVWTFRDRPVYTHGGDKKPGDANGDAWGEFNGYRNGWKAFWIRDDFLSNAG